MLYLQYFIKRYIEVLYLLSQVKPGVLSTFYLPWWCQGKIMFNVDKTLILEETIWNSHVH